MPRRNREQQDKHNESRRKFIRDGKKAIFCIKHIEHTHPNLVKETYKIYDYLYKLYPGKRNLAKTDIYLKEIVGKKINNLEPVLTIPLIQTRQSTSSTQTQRPTAQIKNVYDEVKMYAWPSNTSTTETQRPTSTSTQTQQSTSVSTTEIPILTDEETTTLVRELQSDPDLKYFFSDEALNQVTVSAEPEGVDPISAEEEIDRIIQQEFEALGNDLFELECKDDELMC